MLLPHKFNERKLQQYLKKLYDRQADIVADVALWNLPYVTAIMGEIPDTKFICLQRDREDTIQSFMRKTRNRRNHWTNTNSVHWDEEKWSNEHRCPYKNCYPRFDADKEEALGFYWDYYYIVAGTYQDAFPDAFRIFPIEFLNTRNGCESILAFAGYEEMTIKIGFHKNKQDKEVIC
jgi:hypothetical protein